MSAAKESPTGRLCTTEETARLIRSGQHLLIGADAALLATLPRGNWIGGSTPYFVAEDGGACSRQSCFVTSLPAYSGGPAAIRAYDASTLPSLCKDGPDNGFSFIIIPAFSELHAQFAHDAPGYEDMYVKPLVGWIAGAHLDEIATARAMVVNGSTLEASTERALVMHVPLPDHLQAQIHTINLFQQGDGAALRFPAGGFSADACTIDGLPGNLADYLSARNIDTRLPLVADYSGAMINVSIKNIDLARRTVDFYAPVFPGVDYRVAAGIADYDQAFASALPDKVESVVFSCNCILNYAYSRLEGKKTGTLRGPVGFGEVAYQLLNQTLVYLTVEDFASQA